MWKWRKEEQRPASVSELEEDSASAAQPESPVVPARVVSKEVFSVEAVRPFDKLRADVANIGKSVIIKGELSGSEDLYLDGEVEGSIELQGHNLTVGPNGRVRAGIHAKGVIVHGKVDGNVCSAERVELKQSAVFTGDIVTQRIAIEDGAYFKGSVDIQPELNSLSAKPEPKSEAKPEPALTVMEAPGALFGGK